MVIAKTVHGEQVPVDKKDFEMATCIYGVIIRDGKILISPQWKENGYDFPGGHLGKGENHLDGLVREVREETGFTVKPLKVIDVFTTFFIHPRTKVAEHCTMLYYAAEVISGEISADGFDEGERSYAKPARFVTLDELEKMEFMCSSREMIIKPIMKYLEEQIINVNDIPIVKNFADSEMADLKKILICVHGFNSSKESESIAHLVPALKKQGYGLVAFDLPGHGEHKSKGLTIRNCLDCICAVENDIRTKYHGPICMLGSSFGGYLTLLHLINNKRQYDKIFLRVPAIDFYRTCIAAYKSGWRETKLDFLEEVWNNYVFDGAQTIKEKINIIYGTKDTVVHNDDIFRLKKVVNCKIYPIEGAGHRFNDDEKQKVTEIILKVLKT